MASSRREGGFAEQGFSEPFEGQKTEKQLQTLASTTMDTVKGFASGSRKVARLRWQITSFWK